MPDGNSQQASDLEELCRPLVIVGVTDAVVGSAGIGLVLGTGRVGVGLHPLDCRQAKTCGLDDDFGGCGMPQVASKWDCNPCVDSLRWRTWPELSDTKTSAANIID